MAAESLEEWTKRRMRLEALRKIAGEPYGEKSRFLTEKFCLSDPDARSILQESKDIEEAALAAPRGDLAHMLDRSWLDRLRVRI